VKEPIFSLFYPLKDRRTRSLLRANIAFNQFENCLACRHREERLFCNLPEASRKTLSAITSSASYPKGATLFVEGQPARGVFILCTRPGANQADADARRNRADERLVAGDSDEAAGGFPEKATGAGDGVDTGDQE
jgi:hypothetical protein